METNREKFMKLVTEHDDQAMKDVKWRIRNRWWTKWRDRIQIRYYIIRDKIWKG